MALFPELVNKYLNSRPIPCRRLQAQLHFAWIRFLFYDTITIDTDRQIDMLMHDTKSDQNESIIKINDSELMLIKIEIVLRQAISE